MTESNMTGSNMTESNMREAIDIISNRELSSVYQPIVSLKDGSIYGYEALSRINNTDSKISIADLFAYADKAGYLWELEKICRTNALKNAKGLPPGVKLFLNVDGNVLRDETFQRGFTKEKLNHYSISIQDVVLEITEHSDVDDFRVLGQIVDYYRNQGYEIAMDDLGSGYSGLNRLQYLQPGYVKIDYELIHNIAKDKSRKTLVRMLVRYCSDMNYQLIAEGIETEEELKCLINLGVDYGQGFLLGKPKPAFEKIPKSIVKYICEMQKNKNESKNKVGHIGKMGIVLYPSSSVERAKMMFDNIAALQYIAVVDGNCKFHGLIDRASVYRFLNEQKKGNTCIENIMERNVLQIDADKSIKALIGKLMQRNEQNFYDPLVILKKDRYFGIVTVRDVLIAIGKEL